MKNKVIQASIVAFTVLFQFSCATKVKTDLTKTAFIPKPVSVVGTGNTFELTRSITVYYQAEVEGLQHTAQNLALELNRIGGINPVVMSTTEMPATGIYLSVGDTIDELSDEGYIINIDEKIIKISANSVAGCFYGIQTLLQTIPGNYTTVSPLEIATGIIRDFPEFGYRGAMLDVARHFFFG